MPPNKEMSNSALICLNIFYYLYILILTIVFEILSHLIIIPCIIFRIRRIDDIYRIHNWVYGQFIINVSRPLLKVKVEGIEKLPASRPLVVVFNHNTYVDIFFTALVPVPNMLIVVKGWPFRVLRGINFFMRMAAYMDIEQLGAEEFMKRARELLKRKVSFQFFPEGHRSRDGSLGRFKSGAFLLAAENNIPLVPVCMTGIEKFQTSTFPFIHPSTVTLRVLSPVFPENFEGELRSLEMRRHVKNMFMEAMNELR
ncbi:MAG: hypothetical protein A2017_04565 [Lentisphaerae bacterium GWF2_44_16]|nr:MAG: hypothetical protein A2017_04565 [Lentisphaerae bacterium GWF2_44_16]